jgi:heterotetrameric sarcosine oxidase gamma subunit
VKTTDAPLKLTPLHPVALRLQATLTEQHGWQVAEVFNSVADELIAGRGSVALADSSSCGKMTVQGDRAGALLQRLFDLPELAVSSGADYPTASIYRLRQDLFFAATAPAETESVSRQLTEAAAQADTLVSITDMTHAWSEIRVLGPTAPTLLSKVCGLDFHPAMFLDGMVQRTSVAKITQLIIRRDSGSLPVFALWGARSLAVYLWDVITEAGQEFGLQPIGQTALDQLLAAD